MKPSLSRELSVQSGQDRIQLGGTRLVRRIEEHEVEPGVSSPCSLEEPPDVRAHDGAPILEAGRARRLSRTAATAGGALSTNVACAAPRDSASMPTAPVPA